jgi:hypothetical protein
MVRIVRVHPASGSTRAAFHVFVSVADSVTRNEACFGFAAEAVPAAKTNAHANSARTPGRSLTVSLLAHHWTDGKFGVVRFVQYC